MAGRTYMLRNRKLLALGVVVLDVAHTSSTTVYINVEYPHDCLGFTAGYFTRINGWWVAEDLHAGLDLPGKKWKHLSQVKEFILDNYNFSDILGL